MKSKGFTIIELLVVVAIIAVLAAIVLVNVTGYINQGKNAAIKGNMSTILTNAAVYYDDPSAGNGDYGGFGVPGAPGTGDSSYENPAAAAKNANGGTDLVYGEETDDLQKWCACSPLKTTAAESGTFCVDSSGYKGATETACGGVGGRCTSGAGGTNGACQP